MKISSALKLAKEVLTKSDIESASLDSLILLCHVLNRAKEQVIFYPDLEISQSQKKKFFNLVNARANRKPISHLVNKREFFGHDFLVNQNVLDPRPDSESLIELTQKEFVLAKHNNKFKILELGVGSGCLIITLLKYYDLAIGIGIDISLLALETCKINADLHNVNDRLTLIQSDLFVALNSEYFCCFDLIISNPPYIATKDIDSLAMEVRLYEPKLALDGGESGVEFYKKIAVSAKKFLKPHGKIIVEIGDGQAQTIIEIFKQQNFCLQAKKQDLSGIVRALCFIN